MIVTDFIRANKDWEEIITKDPYNITVKRYDGKDPVFNGLMLLKYNQISSDFSKPLVQACRGIIIHEGTLQVVCWPMNKFFNHGEPNAHNINWSTARVQTKHDGSIIKMYYYEGQWRLASNGGINAFEIFANGGDYSLGRLFIQALGGYMPIIDFLHEEYTYMFELCTPFNQVVVPHDHSHIVFIAMRSNIDGMEVSPRMTQLSKHIPTPKEYGLNSLGETIEAADALPWDNEGYVVVDNNFNRVKVKSPAYVRAHKIAGNNILTVERAFDIIEAGEQDEVLTYFPHHKEKFDRITSILNEIHGDFCEEFGEMAACLPNCPDRKSFALAIKDMKFKSLFFIYYGDRDLSIVELYDKMKRTSLLKEVEKRYEAKIGND